MKKKNREPESPALLDMSRIPCVDPVKAGGVLAPVWTANKARLIQLYLQYFVYITKTGHYIDLFAGPQKSEHPNTWAAKLVLESEPKRLRRFALFELDEEGVSSLQSLASYHLRNYRALRRKIRVLAGDANERIRDYLSQRAIGSREPTFCLLDQRSFECHWETVQLLSQHKQRGNKIELFYFLAQGWMNRTIAAHSEPGPVMERWWGRKDWELFKKTPWPRRGLLLAERFRTELGYRFAHPYPIYERPHGGKVMFYMVHASDHPDARPQMDRAYRNAVAPWTSNMVDQDLEL